MDTISIERKLLRESKSALAELLSRIINLCTYDREARSEYQSGWVDSRIAILRLTGLDRFIKKEV